jgi:3-hydroxybutyryl-CoA dehydrogenase
MTVQFSNVGIIGAGAMGRGIAQIAAQAGSQVLLLDSFEGAAHRGRDAIVAQWQKLREKGKIDEAQHHALSARIHAVDSTQALAGCDLVIEAVVEDLAIKRKLFQELEAVVAPSATLATNTSSLSVTAIAAAMAQPQRMAGFHFFNPVPLMKVVEVVAGFKTDAEVCRRLAAYATQMGHAAVQAKDTPGFIVNHAGRDTVPRRCASPARGSRTSPPSTASSRTRRASGSGPSSCWT